MLKNGDLEGSASRGLLNPETQLGYHSKSALFMPLLPFRLEEKDKEKLEIGKFENPRFCLGLGREKVALLRFLFCRKKKEKGTKNYSRPSPIRPVANAMHYTRSKVPAMMSGKKENKAYDRARGCSMMISRKQPKNSDARSLKHRQRKSRSDY